MAALSSLAIIEISCLVGFRLERARRRARPSATSTKRIRPEGISKKKRRGPPRRKVCPFCADKNARIDYKNPAALKRLVTERRGWFLKSENPDFPDLTPQRDLEVQGVLVGLVRRWKD